MDKKDRGMYHVEVKNNPEAEKHSYYGSLKAVTDHIAREQLAVSLDTLYRHEFEAGPFENYAVIIRKGNLKTPIKKQA